jgi:hypothetical protein
LNPNLESKSSKIVPLSKQEKIHFLPMIFQFCEPEMIFNTILKRFKPHHDMNKDQNYERNWIEGDFNYMHESLRSILYSNSKLDWTGNYHWLNLNNPWMAEYHWSGHNIDPGPNPNFYALTDCLMGNDNIEGQCLLMRYGTAPLHNQIIGFGKHKGKTFKEVISNDKGYCRWFYQNSKENLRSQTGEFWTYLDLIKKKKLR